MDRSDKELLEIIQYDFPISSRPYKEIGKKISLSEEEVIIRIKKLKEEKIIRRIGGVFASKKLGYTSLLCSVKILESEIDEAARILNEYPGITHNYQRKHEYNLWFTLITENNETKDRVIKEIEEKIGCEVKQFPAIKTFKLRAVFKIPGEEK